MMKNRGLLFNNTKVEAGMKDIPFMVWETVLENCITKMEALMKGLGRKEKYKDSVNFSINLETWPMKGIGLKENFTGKEKS